jgi:hypothetical protein
MRARGLYDQVEMVGHQAGREDRQIFVFLRFVHQGDEGGIVSRLVEDFGTTIRAVEDVVTVVRDDGARGTWHTPRLRSAAMRR